jgi:hypothetical protein
MIDYFKKSRQFIPYSVLLCSLCGVLISATKSAATYYYGVGASSGQSAGFSEGRAYLETPSRPLFTDGEYIRTLVEVRDKAGVSLTAGPIQRIYFGQRDYSPSCTWTTVAEGRRLFVDTSVDLQETGFYSFRANYAGSGQWAAQLLLSTGLRTFCTKNLSLSRPMDTVAGGAEAVYTSTGIGYYGDTYNNEYRLGGTSTIYPYIYSRIIRNSGSVTISPALADPYYEWFVSGP